MEEKKDINLEEQFKEKKVGSKDEAASFKSEIFDWIKEIIIAFVVVFLITTFVAQLTNVVGKSMVPTLQDGDHIIIEKISKRLDGLDRYDIVVFPHEEDILYIKRIIALPGETVDIKDGKVYVNDKEIDSKYEFELIEKYGDNLPIVVPEGEYFVLGDNRNKSYDSRYKAVGTVKAEEITGRALIRVWPLNKIGTME